MTDFALNNEGEEEQSPDSTYWKRVRYPEELIFQKKKPWKLQYVEGKGYIALATSNFKAGDWICTEFPVVWIHGHHPFNDSQVAEIHEKVEMLSAEDKEPFYAIANMFPTDEYPPAVGIFMTNCFDMTDSIYGTTCAMYLALARLNHSCSPNVQQTHLPETTEEVLYASRDIAIGEEINDCYIDLRQNREERRKSLLEYYRFHCECVSCSLSETNPLLFAQENDLRTRVYHFEETITAFVEKEEFEKAITFGEKILKEMETTEMMKWSIRYLPEVYHILFQVYKTLQDISYEKKEKAKYKKLAQKFIKKCCKLNILLQGEKSPESQRTLLEVKECLEAGIS
jgi:hypothetical protein